MLNYCEPGQKAWLISNGIFVQEVEIGRISGGFALVKFSAGGGIRVRLSRLYETKEEAESIVKKNKGEEKRIGKKDPAPDYLRAIMQ